MQHLAPGGGVDLVGPAHDLASLELDRLDRAGHQLELRAAAPQRVDQRLAQRDGAVPGQAIAPGLEEVGPRQVPGRGLGGLVAIDRQVDPLLGLGVGLGEAEVDRGVVDRVAAEHQHGVDLAGVELIGDCLQLAEGVGLGGRQHLDGAAEVAEQLVEALHPGVDPGRLGRAAGDQARAAVGGEVLGQRRQEVVGAVAAEVAAVGSVGQLEPVLRGQLGLEIEHEGFDLLRAQRQAVVRGAAGDRVAALDRVDPAHLPFRLALAGEAAGVAQGVGVGGERVVVERQHAQRALEVVQRPQRLAEGHLAAGGLVLAADRLPAGPGGLGEALGELGPQPRHARRAAGLGHHGDAGAAAGAVGQALLEPAIELLPAGVLGAPLLQPDDALAAVRVIHLEGGGLRVNICGAGTCGVIGVALDLRRATIVAGHHQAHAPAAQLHGRGEAARHAGHAALGAVVEGDDGLLLPVAAGGPGQRDRRPYQLQEPTPRGLGPALLVTGRKFGGGELLVLGGGGELLEAAPVGPVGFASVQR